MASGNSRRRPTFRSPFSRVAALTPTWSASWKLRHECPSGNTLAKDVRPQFLVARLLLATDRQHVLLRLHREISFGEASDSHRDTIGVLTRPLDVIPPRFRTDTFSCCLPLGGSGFHSVSGQRRAGIIGRITRSRAFDAPQLVELRARAGRRPFSFGPAPWRAAPRTALRRCLPFLASAPSRLRRGRLVGLRDGLRGRLTHPGLHRRPELPHLGLHGLSL